MPFVDTRDLPVKEPLPGWKGRFFHYDVTAGAASHEHDHPNEEVWHVLAGELAVTVAGVTTSAGPGGVVLVPPNTRHAVRAVADARVIVVDHPRRAAIGGATTD